MGPVVSGYIRLSGHLQGCIYRELNNRADRYWFDDDNPLEQDLDVLEIFLLPVGYSQHARLYSNPGEQSAPVTIKGLILKAVSIDDDKYERIGVFAQRISEHCTEADSERVPEFSYSDIAEFERRIITLI